VSVFPLVKGLRLRATKVNSCGLPVSGAANYVVTNGFVTAGAAPVYQDAEELEQRNAEGRVCVAERTPPERKYYTLTIVLCQVNTCLISLFNGWTQELDWDGNPVGFHDQREVESDFGVALEIWSGGRAEDDCPTPTDDSVFAGAGTGKQYGYTLIFGTEFTLGDLEIGAEVSNLTLTGISFNGSQWGRGPWNVVPIDAINTAGRLITPITKVEHIKMLRTPIEPPPATPGQECCPLDIPGTFTDPDFYFGGPAAEPAADVAPPQPVCDVGLSDEIVSVTFTGASTLVFGGDATASLGLASTAAQVQAALEGLPSIGTGNVVVSGTAPGPHLVHFVNALADTNVGAITGGTPANVTISVTQPGGA
jgi:hypothetical protein